MCECCDGHNVLRGSVQQKARNCEGLISKQIDIFPTSWRHQFLPTLNVNRKRMIESHFTFSELCPVLYTLWTVPCAIHTLNCALCYTHSELCPVLYTLWTVPCAIRTLNCALCYTHSELCPVLYALWTVLCAIRTLNCALCYTHSELCPVLYTLWTVPCAIHNLNCALYCTHVCDKCRQNAHILQ
jgi:hypothetical protein